MEVDVSLGGVGLEVGGRVAKAKCHVRVLRIFPCAEGFGRGFHTCSPPLASSSLPAAEDLANNAFAVRHRVACFFAKHHGLTTTWPARDRLSKRIRKCAKSLRD